jgi:hypothetical protein
MDSIQEKVIKLKEAAHIELSFCNPADTPYLCHLLENSESKDKIVDRIVTYVANEGISISNAISKIETELNPNYIAD